MNIGRLANVVLAYAPHWLLDLAEWMIAHDSHLVRWVKARAAKGLPVPVPTLPDDAADVRVLFGPFNYAGQAWHWAQSLTRHEPRRISARNFAVIFPNGLGFESDSCVSAAVFSGSEQWQTAQKSAYVHYSHVVIESFTSTLGWGRKDGLVREISWHRDSGRGVALLCHGTDIRSPENHRNRNAYSPFAGRDRATDRLERRVAENARILASFDGPVYFSTPDLIHDVPAGEWLPLVVEPEKWEVAAERAASPGERSVPVVLHAPTSARIKGTEFVERAVAAIDDRVSYRPLTGVPASEMPRTIAAADIVVDQLLLGSYGVTACEAMAAGRVVVGNVDGQVRSMVKDKCGVELPIVQADPETLEGVLRRLASDPEERERVAGQGPEFVRIAHSGEQVYTTMRSFLGL